MKEDFRENIISMRDRALQKADAAKTERKTADHNFETGQAIALDKVLNLVDRETPPQLPEIGNLGFEDMEAAFNMRDWLQKACEAQGAKITGGGFGGGVADLDIALEGNQFMVSIKPLSRGKESDALAASEGKNAK